MAETQYAKGHIFALTGMALSCTAITNYISPNLQGISVDHASEGVQRIKNQSGEVASLIFTGDDEITIHFDIIPEGVASVGGIPYATATAAAKASAYVPKRGQTFGTSGFPVIVIGGFADALNTPSNSPPFIYEGGASWNGPVDGVWTMKLPLKRYINITSGTPVT